MNEHIDMTLQIRTKYFLSEYETPMTRFARRVELDQSTVRKWLKGKLKLSQESEQRIADFLTAHNC